MKTGFYFTVAAAALMIGACSNADETAKAPPGAMESFAANQAAEEAATAENRVDAARARETQRATDARQKVEAAESMNRFDRTEAALEESNANKAQ